MGKTETMCDCEVLHAGAVEIAKKHALDEDILIDISDFYKALSDSTRVKIINLLDRTELCVCDISAVLNMTKSAVSHQLKNLKDAEIVKSRKAGKEVFYSLSDEHVKKVFEISLEHVLEKQDE